MTDIGEIWDQLVESSRRRTSATQEVKPFGTCPLKLRLEPRRHWLPRVERDLHRIKLGLRLTLRALVKGEKPWPLFVHGPVGTGKTCAALCLLDYAGGFYYTAPGLCEALIQAQQGRLMVPHSGRPVFPENLWTELGETALVVLDELGAREKASDFAYETIKRLVDERTGRPLVCLSNLDADALASVYDDRLASRVACGTVLTVEGEDLRFEGK